MRLERANALPSIIIRDLTSNEEHAIAFDEAAYSLGTLGGYEFDTTNLRFSYSSMTTPSEVFDSDMVSRERILRKRQEIPSGHNPADYVTTRIMATSHGGAQVPVSILYRKGLVLDGHAPLLLYGYGSVRPRHPCVILGEPAVTGRPRICLCHCAHPRRIGQRLGLVSRRQTREEDQHVRRFRRRQPCADRTEIYIGEKDCSAMAAAPAAC